MIDFFRLSGVLIFSSLDGSIPALCAIVGVMLSRFLLICSTLSFLAEEIGVKVLNIEDFVGVLASVSGPSGEDKSLDPVRLLLRDFLLGLSFDDILTSTTAA